MATHQYQFALALLFLLSLLLVPTWTESILEDRNASQAAHQQVLSPSEEDLSTTDISSILASILSNGAPEQGSSFTQTTATPCCTPGCPIGACVTAQPGPHREELTLAGLCRGAHCPDAANDFCCVPLPPSFFPGSHGHPPPSIARLCVGVSCPSRNNPFCCQILDRPHPPPPPPAGLNSSQPDTSGQVDTPFHPDSCVNIVCPDPQNVFCCQFAAPRLPPHGSESPAPAKGDANHISLVAQSAGGTPITLWALTDLDVTENYITRHAVEQLRYVIEYLPPQTEEDLSSTADGKPIERLWAKVKFDVIAGSSRTKFSDISFNVVDEKDKTRSVVVGSGFLKAVRALTLHEEFMAEPEHGVPTLISHA